MGGVTSEMLGGKFKYGAITSAYGHLFNYRNHEEGMGRPADEQGIDVVVGDEGSKTGLKVMGGIAAVAGGPGIAAAQRGLVTLVNSDGMIVLSAEAVNLTVDSIAAARAFLYTSQAQFVGDVIIGRYGMYSQPTTWGQATGLVSDLISNISIPPTDSR